MNLRRLDVGVLALPLRWKLTLVAAVVLTLVLGVFGTLLYAELRGALLDTTANGLRVSARAAINEQLNGPAPPKENRSLPAPGTPPLPSGAGTLAPDDAKPLADLAERLTTRDTAARVTDTLGATIGDGPALAGIATVRAPLLDAAIYQQVAASNRERRMRVQTADGPVVVELIPLVREGGSPSQPIGVLQLSTSLQSVEAVLDRLRFLLVAGTLVALVVTVLLTIPLVRGVLRPLRRMAATSRAIAAGDLGRRVPTPPGADELTDLALAFNDMVSRLDAVLATQRRFIADASHELRSPLTALGGGIEMLLLGADRGDAAARNRLLSMLAGEVARMGRLVDDLLVLTRFDARPQGALHVGPVDLSALVAHVAEETRLLAPDRVVTLDVPPAITIVLPGDTDRLRQALLNLCDNARAYTAPGGRIAIGLGLADGAARVTIADDGVGIPPADLPRVWERFYRADAARARQSGHGGIGLGLALVRATVEAHGGSTTIASALGAGTTVTLTLPDATASSVPLRDSVPASAS